MSDSKLELCVVGGDVAFRRKLKETLPDAKVHYLDWPHFYGQSKDAARPWIYVMEINVSGVKGEPESPRFTELLGLAPFVHLSGKESNIGPYAQALGGLLKDSGVQVYAGDKGQKELFQTL